ncbi:MAG: ABC transporter permease [Caldilineaceae bacterium]|nr:ABC transporter permease [Caldilineaceae bacterium]
MQQYILRRVLTIIPLLLILYTIVFFLIRSAPGGPWDSTKPMPAAVRDNVLKHYGLNEPILKQYYHYLWNLISQGDMGPSYRQPNRTVNEVLGSSISISVQLGLCAIILSIVGGVSLGLISSINSGKLTDFFVSIFVAVGISVPEYVTTPLLILIMALTLHLVPTSGWDGLFSPKAIIPIFALAIRPLSSIARYTRSSMLDVLGSQYLISAKARGLSYLRVVIGHALPNALIPILTIVGTHTAFIITGSFFVETAYGIPGFGRLFIDSIGERDYPVVMGITLLIGSVMIIMNLILDILYSYLDPRINFNNHSTNNK